jgi:hypothetical protein
MKDFIDSTLTSTYSIAEVLLHGAGDALCQKLTPAAAAVMYHLTESPQGRGKGAKKFDARKSICLKNLVILRGQSGRPWSRSKCQMRNSNAGQIAKCHQQPLSADTCIHSTQVSGMATARKKPRRIRRLAFLETPVSLYDLSKCIVKRPRLREPRARKPLLTRFFPVAPTLSCCSLRSSKVNHHSFYLSARYSVIMRSIPSSCEVFKGFYAREELMVFL